MADMRNNKKIASDIKDIMDMYTQEDLQNKFYLSKMYEIPGEAEQYSFYSSLGLIILCYIKERMANKYEVEPFLEWLEKCWEVYHPAQGEFLSF